jgi:EAL and modified HD-GYP domain-containing signal transduction protein
MIAAIDDETPVGEVSDRLRTVPHLIMNLLSMANLMRGAPAQRIDSLEQALVMVGRSQLLSWLHLLLLASDDEQGCAHPLCRMAAVRGKAMESLARIRLQKRIGTHELEPSRAALTGMLSLTPALFGMTAKAISQKLGLDYSIEAALMRREGSLGKLLTLRERLEEDDLDGVAAMLDELGLTPAELQHSEIEAAAWANGLSAMPTNRAARAARR